MSRRGRRTLAGATTLIAGGGSGIGLALGRAMGGHGARVVLADVDFTAAQVAAEAASAGGLDVTCVALDVTDRAAFADVVDALVRTMGGIDYLLESDVVHTTRPTLPSASHRAPRAWAGGSGEWPFW